MKKTLFILVLILLLTTCKTSTDKEAIRTELISKVQTLSEWCKNNGEFATQSILLTLEASLIMNQDTVLCQITAEYSRLILETMKKRNKNKI